jgi:hypothetical protein
VRDFTNKKIRKCFEDELRTASAEDLALLIAACQPLLNAALERIQDLSKQTNVTLEPLLRPADPPKAG